MDFLTDLWLPILLSAVAVFVISSMFHMLIPIHKGDTRSLANEDAVMDTLRAGNVSPGEYMFPFCADMKDLGSDEMKTRLARGPVAFLTVVPSGPHKIGSSLVQWFLYSILIGIFVAFVGARTLLPGASFSVVFEILGAIAVLPYALAHLHELIWRGRSIVIVAKFMFEGVLYGLATAAVFALLWPAAA